MKNLRAGISASFWLSYILLSKHLKIKMHRTIILPVVFYGFETWSCTLRERYRLRFFKCWVKTVLFKKKEVS